MNRRQVVFSLLIIAGILALFIWPSMAETNPTSVHTFLWTSDTPGVSSDLMTVDFKPTKNIESAHKARMAISIGVDGDPDIPAGNIRITLPRYIFFDRADTGYGAGIGTIRTMLPKAPDKNDVTSFHYVENDDGTITIMNHGPLKAGPASSTVVDFEYLIKPWQVASYHDEDGVRKKGYLNKDITAHFEIQRVPNGPVEKCDTAPLTIKYETTAKLNGVSKRFLAWDPATGYTRVEPHPDLTKYIYVHWYVTTSINQSNTQPFTIDAFDMAEPKGELLAWESGTMAQGGSIIKGDWAAYEKARRARDEAGNPVDGGRPRFTYNQATDPDAHSNYYSTYERLFVRYPRSLLQENDAGELAATFNNTYKTRLYGMDDGFLQEQVGTAKLDYVEKKYVPKESKAESRKYGSGTRYGYINLLEKDPSAWYPMSFTVQTSTSAVGMSGECVEGLWQPGTREWTNTITDNKLEHTTNPRPRLTEDEYRVSPDGQSL